MDLLKARAILAGTMNINIDMRLLDSDHKHFTLLMSISYISQGKGTSQTNSSSQVFQTALSLSSLWMDGWMDSLSGTGVVCRMKTCEDK